MLERFTHTVGNKKSSKKTSKMEEKEFLRLFIRFITWHTGSSYLHHHRSDEYVASPYNVNILYSNQVMRVNRLII